MDEHDKAEQAGKQAGPVMKDWAYNRDTDELVYRGGGRQPAAPLRAAMAAAMPGEDEVLHDRRSFGRGLRLSLGSNSLVRTLGSIGGTFMTDAIEKAREALKQWECWTCKGAGFVERLTEVGAERFKCTICKGAKLDPRATEALAALAEQSRPAAAVEAQTTEDQLLQGLAWMRSVWLADDATLPDSFRFAYQALKEFAAIRSRSGVPTKSEQLQPRVAEWMQACFGPEISADRIERNHRFIEEALELVQACGCTKSEAQQLVDYVFDRPQGDINQEVGGVMVTLAALCLANGFDMHAAGETELARVWTMIEKIRAKQAAKPKHSPLPEAVPSQEEGKR